MTYSGTASATKETGWKLVLESFSFSAVLNNDTFPEWNYSARTLLKLSDENIRKLNTLISFCRAFSI